MAEAAPLVARLTGVGLRYGEVTALERVDLELPGGVMVGLIGPDGVGKSSLLALVAGARKAQTGRIEVFGGDLRDRRFRDKVQPRIAYMPQGLGRNLYQTLSVEENVDFFGRLFGQDRAERSARIDELLAATGLAPFRERSAAKLSGGMKQKLGLCCALIHDPDLLILDEPTTGVDPLSRRQFWALIAGLRARRPGMSVLVATAYMEEAERFDWLVAMDAGRIVGTGTAAALKTHTGGATLEEAFIRLLPEERRREHHVLVIPPRVDEGDGWAIEAEGLTERFGDFTAVDHVSFSIARGEIFGFLGPNGAGKTTTIRMVAGVLRPSEGRILVDGDDLHEHPARTKMKVGYVPDRPFLYEKLSGGEFLRFVSGLWGKEGPEAEARADRLLELFQLAPWKDELIESYSHGMRQKILISSALIHQPEIIVVDEPMVGLDPRSARILKDLLRAFVAQGGTVFLSTHTLEVAEALCDRIAIISDGRIIALGTMEELRAQAHAGGAHLEEIFLKVTGSEDMAHVIESLRGAIEP